MFRCYVCSKSIFLDNKSLLDHYQEFHPLLKIFRCNENNCNRSFSIFDSFKKHRYIKHSSQNHKCCYLNVEQNDEKVDSCNTTKILYKKTDVQSIEDYEDIKDCENFEYIFPEIENDLDVENDSEDDSFFENFQYHIQNSISTTNINEHKEVIHYISKLYTYLDVPRVRVNDIVTSTKSLIDSYLLSLQNSLLNRLKIFNLSFDVISAIKEVFIAFNNPFTDFKSEWRFFQFLQSCDTLIFPENYLIGEREEFRDKNDKSTIEIIPVYAQFIPLRKVFQKLFEIPDVFDKTLSYYQSLRSNKTIIENFVQGSLWEDISSQFTDKIVYPLFLFFDDYETNNVLGTHRGLSKCGAIYVTIPCLPPDMQSKLDNIFLFLLFNSLDRQMFQNRIVLQKAIVELHYLQTEGITIKHKDGKKQVFFVLSLVLGDNLGIHSMLGFVESFNATFFCRFCLTNRKKICHTFDEGTCILRNVDNYTSLLALNDVSKSGIVSQCVFHDLGYFHVTKNLSVDVMHDLLEGVCRYDLALFLNYFIDKKYLNRTDVNTRIRSFRYSYKHNINKPVEITEQHLKNNTIIMSAAEMLLFIKHFCLIIGPFVPVGDECWQLVIFLKQIIDITTSCKVHCQTYNVLHTIINEYLILLNNKFPDKMKPKHHFLIHYARIMKSVGVLWKINSIRSEGKHREGKKTAQATNSRVNISRTIAIKHQLLLNYRFQHNITSCNLLTHGPVAEQSLNEIPFINNVIIPFEMESYVLVAQWICYNNDIINKRAIIVTFSEEGPHFHFVHLIIINKNQNNFIILTKRMLDCYLNEHLQSYKIYDDNCFEWVYVTNKDLCNSIITHCTLSDSENYIVKKWL